jgi:tetratricopeptide (TPR) repeat protein
MPAFENKMSKIDSLLQKATAQLEIKKIDKAEEIYHYILRVEPNHIVALNELGRIFLLQRKYEQAVVAFKKAIALKPDLAIPRKNLGAALCEMGLLEESFAEFRRYASLVYSSSECAASLQDDRIAPHKILHDQEQCEYLYGNRECYPGCHRFVIQDAERVRGPAINPNLATDDILDSWKKNNPRILIVDNFLTDEALQHLRQFCWGSTIWQRVYENGYLGASAEHGLGSPLLAQIIEELSKSLQPIMGDLPLLQFWALKYDSSKKGVNLHADFAAVNANFWITPDEANLDPDRGGMIVWDKPAPLDWDFKQYNQNEEAGRAFLAECGASPIIIPHRSNRALIFDSNLFHETDKITFRQGYLNRRINITLLFGRREAIAL